MGNTWTWKTSFIHTQEKIVQWANHCYPHSHVRATSSLTMSKKPSHTTTSTPAQRQPHHNACNISSADWWAHFRTAGTTYAGGTIVLTSDWSFLKRWSFEHDVMWSRRSYYSSTAITPDAACSRQIKIWPTWAARKGIPSTAEELATVHAMRHCRCKPALHVGKRLQLDSLTGMHSCSVPARVCKIPPQRRFTLR